NYTYSIDLSASWTNKTVVLKATDSEAPTLVSQVLWNDPSNSSFYAYDGGLSYAIPLGDPPPNQLWQFKPVGSSGAWSQVEQSPSSNFSSLSRVQSPIYASGGDLGFALGGLQNGATGNPQGTVDTPGMVIYNLTSRELFNVSATGYSYNGIAMDGTGIFVPSFGPAGLFFVLAGLIGASSKPTLPSLIFLYGGQGGTWSNPVANDAVFVLSLPAFHWEQSTYTNAFGRRRHSCNVIGNRQMVAVGGQMGWHNHLPPDPWDQGLGIFDMSAMEWKDSYDPNAAAYTSPDSVKAYYKQNGSYPTSWSNDVVRTWFTKAVANNTVTPFTDAGPASPTSSLGARKGALAGIIVGGVAALTLIGLFVLYLLRRRRRHAAAAAAPSSDLGDGYQKPELEDNKVRMSSELEDNKVRVWSELPGVDHTPKVVPMSELPSWQEVHELPVERPELPEKP
ncbi:MAG: hypothetical protein OHK93_002149, partial [Ramalina farinacea]|nr:hypothetical protein [Ramalina farinacea]